MTRWRAVKQAGRSGGGWGCVLIRTMGIRFGRREAHDGGSGSLFVPVFCCCCFFFFQLSGLSFIFCFCFFLHLLFCPLAFCVGFGCCFSFWVLYFALLFIFKCFVSTFAAAAVYDTESLPVPSNINSAQTTPVAYVDEESRLQTKKNKCGKAAPKKTPGTKRSLVAIFRHKPVPSPVPPPLYFV